MKDLIILTKLEELGAYSHLALIQFPKVEKFVLCAEIRQTLMEIMKLTVRAAKRYHKKTTLQDLDIEVEYLRCQVRMAHRMKYINMKRYQTWIAHVDEVGRMVGGWLKSVGK